MNRWLRAQDDVAVVAWLLLGLLACAALVWAIVRADTLGEIMVGTVAIGVTLLALVLAVSELDGAAERGRLERLWALEQRWNSAEVMNARIRVRALQQELAALPSDEKRLEVWQSLLDDEDADRTLVRLQTLAVLNILEEFAESAVKRFVDPHRVRLTYGTVFVRYREEWDFLVKSFHAEDDDAGREPRGSAADRPLGCFDAEARRAGFGVE